MNTLYFNVILTINIVNWNSNNEEPNWKTHGSHGYII